MTRARALLVALVVVMLAGACSSGSSHDTVTKPRHGGAVRVAVVGLRSLDPTRGENPASALTASLLFEPLVRIDPVSSEPVPALARRWHANPTATVFTFELRPGARFHDGTPVTASDVKATIDRVRAPSGGSPFATILTVVKAVAAPDARTVVVTTTRPFAMLPAVLSQPGLGIEPRALAVQPAKLAAAPVGSGPFRFAARRGTTIELRAARESRRATPWLDAVDIVPYPSAAAAYAAFEAGKVDVAPLTRAESEDADRRGERLVAGPYLAVSFYALSLHDSKLADVRFREAIVRGLDARALVTAGYGATAQVAGGLIPLGVPAGPTNACRARCDHDPSESRRLLATVFPNGKVPPIAIDFDDDPIQRAVAREVQRELASVGIPALPRPHPVAEYSSFLALGGAELFRLGWVADYPSSEAFLAPLFSAGAPTNVVGLKSTAFAEALRAAESEPDEQRRVADFGRAEDAVLDQYVAAPVAQFETRMVIGTRVRGMRLDPFGAFDGAAVWLAPPPAKK